MKVKYRKRDFCLARFQFLACAVLILYRYTSVFQLCRFIKLDTATLGCGFPLWGIITFGIGSGVFIIVLIIIVSRKWTTIKFRYYSRFTNDDDSQDLSQMKYDAFISYR